jgi:hypothetical protein
MKGRGATYGLIALIVLLIVGVGALFNLRLGRGDLFPVYSSLRADPLGTRALHDSLAQVPGLRVERWHKPVKALEATLPRTIVLAGLSRWTWAEFPIEDFAALDAAVRGGSRLVITFRAQEAGDERPAPRMKSDTRKKGKKAEPEERDRTGPETGGKPERIMRANLRQLWGVEVKARSLGGADERAVRAGGDELPPSISWRSDLFFTPEQGMEWRTLYRRDGAAVLLERSLGRGSIVLAADSFFLSNEALQRERSTTLLAWIIGENRRVVFEESHLGVEVRPGIAALARRYGLAGAFFTLVLLAGLFVWRRMALFVPPAEEMAEIALSYRPAAGLEALLRRSVPASELAKACEAEWKRTARGPDVARVAAILAEAPKKTSAAELHNTVNRALRRR